MSKTHETSHNNELTERMETARNQQSAGRMATRMLKANEIPANYVQLDSGLLIADDLDKKNEYVKTTHYARERTQALETETIPLPEFVTEKEFQAAVKTYTEIIQKMDEVSGGEEHHVVVPEQGLRRYLHERAMIWEEDGTADWMREQVANGNSFALSFESSRPTTKKTARESDIFITDFKGVDSLSDNVLFPGRKVEVGSSEVSITMMPREYNLDRAAVKEQKKAFVKVQRKIAPSAKIANTGEVLSNIMTRQAAGERVDDDNVYSLDILSTVISSIKRVSINSDSSSSEPRFPTRFYWLPGVSIHEGKRVVKYSDCGNFNYRARISVG